MALRPEVVNFIRLDLVQEAGQVRSICQITVVENEAGIFLLPVPVEMVDALGVETGRPADDPVNFVAFFQEELGEVGAVLPRDSGD